MAGDMKPMAVCGGGVGSPYTAALFRLAFRCGTAAYGYPLLPFLRFHPRGRTIAMPRRHKRSLPTRKTSTPEEEAMRHALYLQLKQYAERMGTMALQERLEERLGPGWRDQFHHHRQQGEGP